MSAPIGRRQFVASAGGTLFCTLAGHRLTSDSHVNINQLAGGVPVPPRVAAYYEAQARAQTQAQIEPQFVSETRPKAAAGAAVHTYWIKAVKTKWNIVPTHHDGMMDRKVPGKTTFTALAYQPWAPGFAKPLGPPQIPGPLLEAQTGDTIVVNFRNQTGVPVTMHPHGIFYTHDMDGAYKGKYTEPGGFVENGAHLPVRVGGAPRHRGRVALPRPRADGPAARVQGDVRRADHPQAHRPGAHP